MPKEFIFCSCGCEMMLEKFDKKGRERKYIFGHSPNKGKVLTDEHKYKISINRKGISAWNKGILFSIKSRKKMSLAKLGKKQSLEARIKNSIAHSEYKHWNWKGKKVGYRALHTWVEKRLGKPDICKFCGKNGLKGKQIHWANKSHSYLRNLNDWIRLCAKCHGEYDIKFN